MPLPGIKNSKRLTNKNFPSSTRMEALLSDEAIADEAKKFDSSVKMLTLREYDYLDFRLIYN